MNRENHELLTRRTGLSPQQAPCGYKSRDFLTSVKIVFCMLMLAAGLAAGCGAARPSKYYQLTVPGDLAPAANPNPLPITLLIGRMTGPALYREDQIVFSSAGQSMGTYEYHRWAEPPTEMIAEILLRQLRASGQYRGVYTLRSDIHGDFLLHGRLYDFKEVSGSSMVARVTMELELRNIKAGTTVWTHTLRPIRRRSPRRLHPSFLREFPDLAGAFSAGSPQHQQRNVVFKLRAFPVSLHPLQERRGKVRQPDRPGQLS